MIYQRISKMLLLGLLVLPLASCSDDNSVVNNDKLNGDSQFGKANDVFEASEWYPGAIKYAREQDVPMLGVCLGMQLTCIEFARVVIKEGGAISV